MKYCFFVSGNIIYAYEFKTDIIINDRNTMINVGTYVHVIGPNDSYYICNSFDDFQKYKLIFILKYPSHKTITFYASRNTIFLN